MRQIDRIVKMSIMLIEMKKIKDFLINSRRTIVWTIFYCLVMWSILRYLFNFDMLRADHWKKLLTVELHGFAGLVFGILVLAAVPLYIATTVLTVRNKSVPIKIPRPACFNPSPKKEESEPEPTVVEQEVLPELRPGVPAEMRDSFMRAKKRYGVRQQSVFNRTANATYGADKAVPKADVSKTSEAPDVAPVMFHDLPMGGAEKVSNNVSKNTVDTDENPDFPIPKDFDVVGADAGDYDVPVFSEINFDDESNDTNNADESEISPDAVCEILNAAGVSARVDGDLIKTDKFVIAVHGDNEFWVADEFDWFASGKQRPSPIVKLLGVRDADGLSPILYLPCDNIMDLDKLIPEWEKSGIKVVRNEKELMDIVNGYRDSVG